jgi:hypothetical protein
MLDYAVFLYICPDGSAFKNPVVQICVAMVAVIAWYAYKVNQKAQQQVGKLMAHVESLQQAERELKSLQERLIKV